MYKIENATLTKHNCVKHFDDTTTSKSGVTRMTTNLSDIQEPDSSCLKDESRLKELEQQILASKAKIE